MKGSKPVMLFDVSVERDAAEAQAAKLRAERDEFERLYLEAHEYWGSKATKAEAERDEAVERLTEVLDATVTDSGMKGCTYALHLSDGTVQDARRFLAAHGGSNEQ